MKTSILAVDRSMASGAKIRERGEAIRVLLVDDHPEIRQVLRSFLSTYYRDIEVVGEANSGEEALQCVQMLSPFEQRLGGDCSLSVASISASLAVTANAPQSRLWFLMGLY